MKLVLSTSNLTAGGPSVIRRPAFDRSNAELVASLRANILNAQQSAHAAEANGTSTEHEAWTHHEPNSNTLFIPGVDFSQSQLAEERVQYDITVKLFYLPNVPSSQRCGHTSEAISLVLKQLHVPSIDLLIVSFPNVSFDADSEDEDESDATLSTGSEVGGDTEDIHSMVEAWRVLEDLHSKGIIARLGVAEFGTSRLTKFLSEVRVRPEVDQINVRDCCVVPEPLIKYARKEKIELLTHNDCTNILPPGTLRELLGPGKENAGILAGSENDSSGLKGDVRPQWVIKYTAVVKDRGVIESKGYFALADLVDDSAETKKRKRDDGT